MKKKRLIPVLLFKNGWLVQSKGFGRYQNLGNPTMAVKRLSEWCSDELIYIDISKDDSYYLKREDLKYESRQSIIEIIQDVSKVAFMPIAVGGKIRTLEDIEKKLSAGADKAVINTKPAEDDQFVKQAAREFGSQCIVISVDVKLVNDEYKVMTECGSKDIGYNPVNWCQKLENDGAGEILLNSIDRDGMQKGYDIPLLKNVSDAVNIPVIACGGVGEWAHFGEAFEMTNVDAVAAANIFHYMDQSVFLAKQYLYDKGFNVRPPDLI
jgi:imidazole glycerol-phosphate synthase subunit HisF